MAEVFSDTNSTSLFYSEETEWNEEPVTPTMKELQRVSDTCLLYTSDAADEL